MQLHELKRKTSQRKKTIVGRGGTRGKTAGRGTKGQKARAGHKIRPEMRDFIKKLPKLRGRGKNSNVSIQTKPIVVKISELDVFDAGAKVTPTTLVEKGIIETKGNKFPRVKILGNGELKKKLAVSGCEVSAEARAKIEKAGGTIRA